MQRRKIAGPWVGIHVVGVGGGGRRTVEWLAAANLTNVHLAAVDVGRSPGPECSRSGPVACFTASAFGQLHFSAGDHRLEDELASSGIIFVVAGLGGCAGSQLAPEVARLARATGALVVAIVTLPFTFEGPERAAQAQEGLGRLQDNADTVLVISNERILKRANGSLGFHEASTMADILCQRTVQAIGDMVNTCGLINVDLATVRRVLGRRRFAYVGVGLGQGSGRARAAAESAMVSDMLGASADNATDLLINVCGGWELALLDVEQVAQVVKRRCPADAMTIIGATINPTIGEAIQVTVLATGGDHAFGPDGGWRAARRDSSWLPATEPRRATPTPQSALQLVGGL
jgi:cell division protein FtsZ